VMLFLCFIASLLSATGKVHTKSSCSDVVAVLSHWYNNKTGNFDLNNTSISWWESGNALYSTLDYIHRSNDTQYLYMVNTSFANSGTPSGNFISGSYDDDIWWGLAWVSAWDFTFQTQYLDMAKKIFNEVAASWDTVCKGGVWWSFQKTYKNAITNELFLALAIRLYQRTNDTTYLDWAKKEWTWFEASGMINSQNLVNDGLNIDSKTGACTNNGQTTWTYNQGVIVSGLVDLSIVTQNQTLITVAERITNATFSHLTKNGILQETCEPNKNCDENQLIFKGIFARSIYDLRKVNATSPDYKGFLQINANTVWAMDRNAQNQIGLYWSGPFDMANPERQQSGLDLFNSVCFEQ